VLPPGDNVDNSTIISPNNNKSDVNEKKQVNLSNSLSPIESLVVTLLTLGVILIALICFWPYILGGGLLLLIVTVVLRFVWVWLTDRFSKKF
jgi:NhaP-type Na+/H+ or K+/H+ antiporter